MCQRERKETKTFGDNKKQTKNIKKSYINFNTLYLFREIENGNVDEFERK